MAKHPHSVDSQVLTRITSKGAGWVFTPADFADLGSRTAVAAALSRHKKAGLLRQLGRGIYDVPRTNARLGPLWPSVETLVEAIKVRDAVRLQPSGAYAAHILGLTDQVPMRIAYLTDGPARRVQLGKLTISFRPTTPRNMATAGRTSGLVIQALRWIGRSKVSAPVVRHLRNRLKNQEKQELMADVRHAPAWIADVIRQIATKP